MAKAFFLVSFVSMKAPVNSVANKSIITLDISSWIPNAEMEAAIDMKQFLFKELILKEEEFKVALSVFDWQALQGKYVRIYCSNAAIIPTWAYMLICNYLLNVSPFFAYASSREEFMNLLLIDKVNQLPLEDFTNQRLVIKGCGDKTIRESIYLYMTRKLMTVARAISYGEPCSMVPIYRKKVD